MTLIDKAEARKKLDDLERFSAREIAEFAEKYEAEDVERWLDYRHVYDAIAALPARGVGVRKLEWEGPRKLDEGGAAYDAHTTCGEYIATDTGWFLVGRSGWCKSTSLDAAKAAAQADYAARILAALEPMEERK